MFDKGSFSITDDLYLIGTISGKLYVENTHEIKIDNLKYHREVHGYH